ncbi:MAG: flippase [candidate division WOR-3 bacterium]
MNEEKTLEKHLEKYIENLFSGSLLNFIGMIMKRFTGYLYQILIVRLLGTFIYGIYTLSYTLINIVLRFSQLGLDRGGIRYIAVLKEDEKYGLIKKLSLFLFFLSFFSGLLWGIFTFLTSSFFSQIYKKPELREALIYFSFLVPFYTSLLVMAYSSKGFNKMEYYVLSEDILRPIFQFLFLFLLFYFLGKKIITAILPWTLSSLLGLLLIIFFFVKELKGKDTDSKENFNYKEVVTFSLPVTIISILYFLFAWTDMVLLGFFRKAEEIGIYNGIARTAEMANLFLLSINEVFSPLVSQLSYKKDLKSLKNIYEIIIRWTLYFSIPLYIFFLFSGKEFLYIIFGKEFISGFIPMIILLTGLMIQNLIGEVAMTLTMSGYQKEWAFINFLGLFINVILGLLFIPKFGILGASLSTSLSLVILRTMGLFGVKKFLKFWGLSKRVFKPFLQGIFTLLIILFLNTFFISKVNFNILLKVILNFFLPYLFYLLLFFVLKPEKEEIFLINKLRSFIKRG